MPGFSQGEWNQWRFGDHAGLDFNVTPPIPVSGSAMSYPSATVSYSDSSGNLLFYSDGHTIWNKNNLIMQNGSGLLGGYTWQSIFTIPDPYISSQYFLCYISILGFPPMQTTCFSKIDMSLKIKRIFYIYNIGITLELGSE